MVGRHSPVHGERRLVLSSWWWLDMFRLGVRIIRSSWRKPSKPLQLNRHQWCPGTRPSARAAEPCVILQAANPVRWRFVSLALRSGTIPDKRRLFDMVLFAHSESRGSARPAGFEAFNTVNLMATRLRSARWRCGLSFVTSFLALTALSGVDTTNSGTTADVSLAAVRVVC